MTTDLDRLIRQVRYNCDISDARHAGMFSICGLALRLRDLFKWEKGLAPWDEGDPAEVLEWIGVREDRWETLAGSDFANLPLTGMRFDPFDTAGLNRVLEPHGLYYGAGYARGLKPTFFLAVIDSRSQIGCGTIYGLGRELARDLLTLPAMSQGNAILMRDEAARLFLWDQIVYASPSGRKALAAALDACGLSDHRPGALKHHVGRLLEVQRTIHLHHELGELQDSTFDRGLWQEMIAAFPGTRVEFLVRHVKDFLADTSPVGTLPHICRMRDTAALAFYMVFADSMSKALWPLLFDSFDDFLRTGAWESVEHAAAAARATAGRLADRIMSLFRDGRDGDDFTRAQVRIDQALSRHLDRRPAPV
ncbi:MAG: hypothetical protein HY895_12490 [Deltaproteobacteria bacterium]|nr:hypothetical protein [Deltaproteobacteria bacterium]